jgi:dihydropteroate synthase
MREIIIGNKVFDLSKKTLIMGILNVTPDSFSDGGKYNLLDDAVEHAKKMVKDGADIIDIGGESTRPGAIRISDKEEIKRVIPVISALSDQIETPLSIDTSKAKVAELAIKQGACFVNDVTALRADKKLLKIILKYQVKICLMHMKGTPRDMQINPKYDDVINEIKNFLRNQIDYALKNKISKHQILLDPGIGFGKRTGKGIEDNCIILKRLNELTSLGYPLMIGASRKEFIGRISGKQKPLPPNDRLEGSLAAAGIAALNGADIIRVHDVKETRRCLDIFDCIKLQ